MLPGDIQKAEQEVTIDFPIGKVKESIVQVSKELTKYTLKEDGTNEIFNTYQIHSIDGLSGYNFNIGLSSPEENKTTVKISVSNIGTATSNAILAGQITDYFNVLSKVLSGVQLTKLDNKSSSGGIGGVIVIVVFIAICIYFFKSC